MKSIHYQSEKDISLKEILPLYQDAQWTAYIKAPEILEQGLKNSLDLLTARNQKSNLLGIARMVGDGHTIIYIQDIIVLQKHQRKGIGKGLLQKVIEKYKAVRQKVLLTDHTAKTQGFYQSLGFEACQGNPLIAYYHKG